MTNKKFAQNNSTIFRTGFIFSRKGQNQNPDFVRGIIRSGSHKTQCNEKQCTVSKETMKSGSDSVVKHSVKHHNSDSRKISKNAKGNKRGKGNKRDKSNGAYIF